MNIRDEAAKRYPDPFLSHDMSRLTFIAGAEWARKETLREVADAIDSLDGSRATGYYASEAHSGYQEAQNDAERAIRALAEGEGQ